MAVTEAVGVADVARDLVELERVEEAKALLDAELPDRHAETCGACGAWKNSPCRELGMRPCRRCGGGGKLSSVRIGTGERSIVPCDDCYGMGQRETFVDMVVPHESRLIGRKPRWAP